MTHSTTEIETHYTETDKMGAIYHGNHATWFEVVRLDYIPKLGFNYADIEKQGIISSVTDLNVNYKKSTSYPERVKVKTWVEKYLRSRSVRRYEIFNEKGEPATTGPIELTCIKEDTSKPIRLDRYFPDWHEVYSKVQVLNNEGEIVEIMDGIDSL